MLKLIDLATAATFAVSASAMTYAAVTNAPPEPFVPVAGLRPQAPSMFHYCDRGQLMQVYVLHTGEQELPERTGRACNDSQEQEKRPHPSEYY